jgi:hypothetical protein
MNINDGKCGKMSNPQKTITIIHFASVSQQQINQKHVGGFLWCVASASLRQLETSAGKRHLMTQWPSSDSRQYSTAQTSTNERSSIGTATTETIQGIQ